ncbi:MAG: hypothetical protein Q9220_001854 [cf. Caloplaca sp. 1 TL-2023]
MPDSPPFQELLCDNGNAAAGEELGFTQCITYDAAHHGESGKGVNKSRADEATEHFANVCRLIWPFVYIKYSAATVEPDKGKLIRQTNREGHVVGQRKSEKQQSRCDSENGPES